MCADTVLDQIIELPKMSFDEIKQYWKQLFNEDPPSRSKKHILIKKVAYRLQEIAYGVNEDIETRLEHHAEQYFGSGKQKVKKSYQMPIIGTKLVRTYQGIEYQVTILEDGYEFEGGIYTSLSKIAKKITGTAWSGPAFFGLTQKKVHKS
jgi:hypothetical protein